MNECKTLSRRVCGDLLSVMLLFVLCVCEGRGDAPADSVVKLESSNLPIVVINTNGQSIPDEPKIDARMGIIDNGEGVRNYLTDPFNAYNGTIGIELRGSSSQMFPKKQYAVETRDSLGNDLKVALLGLPEESDWVLSAPYSDKSLIRDALMYNLTRSLGRYASRARLCELVLNDDYVGVYVLFEKITRNKNRVNITKLTPADTTGDAITGGYIIKIDKIEGAETWGWNSGFLPYPFAWQKIFYQYHYPKYEDMPSRQLLYIEQFIRDFEIAMYLPSFADSAAGYSRWLDVDSFVDFALLNELGKNVDAYRLSAYFHKDRDSKGGKLVMGPVWDFNLAFGNSDYYDASLIPGFQMTYLTTNRSFLQSDGNAVPFWWPKLFAEAGFRKKLEARWNALRKDQLSLARITAVMDSLTTLLGEAQERNFRRWPVLGVYVWPNFFIGRTYQDEITYLKQWVTSRVAWLDQELSTTSAHPEEEHTEAPAAWLLAQNYPNPFNPATEIRYRIPVECQVNIAVYDMLGREVAVLVNEATMPGSYSVRFDGSRMASGIYCYRLRAGGYVAAHRMVLAR